MHAWPERVASLILADTFAEHPDGRAIYERSLAGSENMRVFAESRVDVLLAQPADPAVRGEVIETMARIDPAAYRIGAEAVWLADQRERAAAIRVPTLVLCGAEDRVTPPALSTALTRLIPGAQYDAIERAGHLSNLERPDAFNTLVRAFVRGVDSRAEESAFDPLRTLRRRCIDSCIASTVVHGKAAFSAWHSMSRWLVVRPLSRRTASVRRSYVQ